MKVYVIFNRLNFESDELIGIYSSFKGAKNKLMALANEEKIPFTLFDDYYRTSVGTVDIEEWGVEK